MSTVATRDIPTRVPVQLAGDSFARTNTAGNTTVGNVGGWGTPSDNPPTTDTWARSGGSSGFTFSISGNTGKATGVAGGTVLLLGSTSYTDTNLLLRVQASSTSDKIGICFRGSGNNNTYRVYLTAGTTLRFDKNITGTPTTLKDFSFTWTAATTYWLRVQISATTTLARVWASGTSEPTTWNIASSDNDNTYASGQLGIYFNLNALADTAQFDSFAVTAAQQGDYQDLPTRIRVQSQPQNKDLASRVRLQAVPSRDLASRVQVQAVASRDLASRVILALGTNLKDLASRVRVQAVSARDVASRVRLQAVASRDVASRAKVQSQPQNKDLASRVRLQAVAARDLLARVKLQAVVPRDLITRARVQSQPQNRDLVSRTRLAAQRLRDLAVRILLTTPTTPLVRDLATRILIALNPSQGITLTPLPTPAGPQMAGLGLVPLAPIPPGARGRYAVSGAALATQPYLAAAPVATAGYVLAGTAFTLAFASADAGTQALLGTPGVALTAFTFATSEGALLSGPVVVTSAATPTSGNLLVTLTLTQTVLVNQWVVPAQSL